MKAFTKKLSRIAVVCRDAGIGGISSRLIGRTLRSIGCDDPKHAKWLREKAVADNAFDEANGTLTGGVEEIFDLRIVGGNARHGLSHIATDPAAFLGLIGKLDIDFASHTFIDLGSGRGRALLLATSLPFRRIIGVEFASEFHESAKHNLVAFAANGGDISRISLIMDDAAAYSFPNEPLVIYMFNPFSSRIVRQVAENALASWRGMRRPIKIFYMNPLHLHEVTEAGWEAVEVGVGRAVFVPKEA